MAAPIAPGIQRVANPGGRPQAITSGLGGPGGGKKAPGKQPPQKATPKGRPAPKAPQSPFYGGEVVNPAGALTRLQRQEIGGAIHNQQVGEEANIRNTFGAKTAESNYTEGQIANRLNTMNQGTQSYLQGLVAGSEGSAKTAHNYAAELAQKPVETAGQTATTNVGGLLPQAQGATERDEANTQALRQIAAATAARGQENVGQNKARFMTENARNRTAENTALGKVQERTAKERQELPFKEYADILAKQRAEGTQKVGEAKVAATNAATAQRGASSAAATAQRGASSAAATAQRGASSAAATAQRGASSAAATGQRENASERAAHTREETSKREWRERRPEMEAKAKYYKVKATAGGGGATPSTQQKYITRIGNVYSLFKYLAEGEGMNNNEVRTVLATGQRNKEGKLHGKPIKETERVNRETDQRILRAGEELYYKHTLTPGTKLLLEKMGLNVKETNFWQAAGGG